MTTRPELSGNQKRKMRTASRLYAVQALFQMEHSGQASDVVAREFLDHRFGAIYDEGEMQEGDPDLFEKIVNDAVNHQALICLLYTSPSPRDLSTSRMPSSA